MILVILGRRVFPLCLPWDRHIWTLCFAFPFFLEIQVFFFLFNPA